MLAHPPTEFVSEVFLPLRVGGRSTSSLLLPASTHDRHATSTCRQHAALGYGMKRVTATHSHAGFEAQVKVTFTSSWFLRWRTPINIQGDVKGLVRKQLLASHYKINTNFDPPKVLLNIALPASG